MSTTKPMSHERRLASYGVREKSGGGLLVTPRQRRRIKHKRNRAMRGRTP